MKRNIAYRPQKYFDDMCDRYIMFGDLLCKNMWRLYLGKQRKTYKGRKFCYWG